MLGFHTSCCVHVNNAVVNLSLTRYAESMKLPVLSEKCWRQWYRNMVECRSGNPCASQTFCVSSSSNWNSLPLHIRSSDSLATFKSRLKSHLSSSAYHVQSLICQRLRFKLWPLVLYKWL